MKGRRNRRKERVMARHEETERNEAKERRKDGVNDMNEPLHASLLPFLTSGHGLRLAFGDPT